MSNKEEKDTGVQLDYAEIGCLRKMLDDVDKARKKAEKENGTKDLQMNIFDIENLITLELPMCRFLKAVLDRNINSQANLFIAAILSELNIPQPEQPEIQSNQPKPQSEVPKIVYDCENNLDDWRVEIEHIIDGNRRIDIALINDTARIFIPIEAKIYAKDGKNQCHDYLEYARKITNDDNVKLIYITISGDVPSEYSCSAEETNKCIHCISWSNIAKVFRTSIDKPEFTECKQTLGSIEQFCDAIVKMTKVVEDSMEMNEILLASEESFKSATRIADSMNSAKTEIMRRFFNKLDNQLGEKLEKSKYNDFLKKIDQRNPNVEDSSTELKDSIIKLDDSIDIFYNKSTTLRVVYKVDEKILPVAMNKALKINNMVFAINIEIKENTLRVGFCLPTVEPSKSSNDQELYWYNKDNNINIDKNKQTWYGQQCLSEKLIKSYNKKNACKKDDWWMQWAYITIDSKKLDFKNDNCLAQLCNKYNNDNNDNIGKWVDACVNVFESYCNYCVSLIESANVEKAAKA